MTEIYGAIGCSKQNISYWHTHAHSTQFKKSVYEVVYRAADFFGLSSGQSELLANSAGLSMQYETVNLIEDLGYQGKIRVLCERAMVSERMFRYYKEQTPSKQALLAMAVSFPMREEEVEKLLYKYGYCLSKSIAGDAVVRWYMQRERGETIRAERILFEINEVLERMGVPLLMTRQQ